MATTSTVPAIPPRTAIGDYRVLERFASGGMGDLYRVVNPLLREVFAMKVLRDDTGASHRTESVQRFFEEARTTVRLRHGNIVTLHTMGLEPISGHLYFIMDYVGLTAQRRAQILGEGPWFAAPTTESEDETREPMSLEDLLALRGPIPEEILRILAADIAAALNHAHQAGVVHCDLKPANVLLRNDGHAVVGDFGIARAYRASDGEAGASGAQAILGTPHYMAPEQRSGSAPLTPATDIYAYGVVLYRLLTGSFPEGVWKRPSELGFSPAWDRLCQDCLARNPADRWPSMRRIHAYLRMMPELTQRLKTQRNRRANRLLAFVSLGLPAAALLTAGALVLIQSLRLSGTDRPVSWVTVHPTPEAFVKGDVARAEVRPEAAGMLAYDAAAPAELPLPPFPLEHINRLALPETTRVLPPGFGDRFPRLEYVICAPGNPVFFAQDGILYRRDDPSRPALLPPRLFGAITLPAAITDFPHPWSEATTTATTLRSHTGAYGRVLFLRAPHPVRWLAR